METEVIMKRELFGMEISQRSKTEYFSATDLARAGNRWRVANGLDFFKMNEWLGLKSTKEFMSGLERHFGFPVKINSKGKNQHTWVHPFLFIDMALAISPELKIQVYSWLMDALLKYRNESGDSYKLMAGSIFVAISNKAHFIEKVKQVAQRIKLECGVEDWQRATESQLKLRDRIHENVALLTDVLRDIDKAVEIGITKARRE